MNLTGICIYLYKTKWKQTFIRVNSAIIAQINIGSDSLWVTNNYSQIKYSLLEVIRRMHNSDYLK